MRRLRPRCSVTWLMVAVLVVGVTIRLLMAASKASPDHVYHVRRYEDTGTLTMRSHRLSASDEIHSMTYWSRYWRQALGLSLTDDPCRCKAYFEMVEGRRTSDVRTILDPSQGDAFLDWIASNPKVLPRTDQELRSAPSRSPAKRKTIAATRPILPPAPSRVEMSEPG